MTNRSVQSVLDSAEDNSTIDMAYLGSSIWSANIDTNKVFDSIKLVNFPSNLTKIILGDNLSRSLSGPLVLPKFLEHFKGPIFDDTMLPQTLKSIVVVETMSSVSLSRLNIPDTAVEIAVVTRDKLSRVDEIRFPKTVETIKIEGSFNASLDNLNLQEYHNLKHIDLPPSFKQHFHSKNQDMVVTRKNINEDVDIPGDIDKKTHGGHVSVISSPRTNIAISKYLPTLHHLKITLDGAIPTISHIWTQILMEGLVRVEKITVKVPENYSTNPFYGIDRVFERSRLLRRPVCGILSITNVVFNKDMVNSYLNMARSMKRIGNMVITINHTKSNFDPKGLLKTMSRELGIQPTEISPCVFKYSSLFGVNESSVTVTDKMIEIVRGDTPRHFSAMPEEEELHVPLVPVSSSHLIVPMEDVDASPPKGKEITLHSWSQCHFCKKQDVIIEEFKGANSENLKIFDKLVDIQKVDNPNSITDKRVRAFPTWVVRDNIESGLKSFAQIDEMLKSIS